MNQTMIEVVLVGVALVVIAIGAYRRMKANRTARVKRLVANAAEPPEGSVFVQKGPIARKDDSALTGDTLCVATGSAGLKFKTDTVITHHRVGMLDAFGSIFALECDGFVRKAFEGMLKNISSDRTVYAFAPAFPNGFINATPEEVKTMIGQWSVPVKERIEQVVKLHEERTGSKPSQSLLFISLGGHSYTAVFLAQELRNCLPGMNIIGVVDLPRNTAQRDSFLRLKPELDAAGIGAWLVTDSMQPDWLTRDSVIADIFAGITVASLTADTRPRLNNMMHNLAKTGVGGMARFEFFYGDIAAHPFQPHPDDDIQYYVDRDQVIRETQSLIEKIEQGQGDVSIDAPTGEPGCHTYDLVLCALEPDDVLGVRDYIEKARDIEDKRFADTLRPHLHAKANYHTIYSSWSKPIDPSNPRCRIGVIRLTSLRDVAHHLPEIVKVPAERNYTTSTPQPPLLVPNTMTAQASSGNGHSEIDHL